jgi:hypothetical protein
MSPEFAATPSTASHATTVQNVSPARARLWSGRALSGLVTLFLAWDAAIKLVRHPMALEGSGTLGYGPHTVPLIGGLAAVCLALYVIPRTAVLGAILMTGYLGGAIATHVRVDNPLFSHVLFPVYVATLLWGGLALRDGRVLTLLGPQK